MPLRDRNGDVIRSEMNLSSFGPAVVPSDMRPTQSQKNAMDRAYFQSMTHYAGVLEKSRAAAAGMYLDRI